MSRELTEYKLKQIIEICQSELSCRAATTSVDLTKYPSYQLSEALIEVLQQEGEAGDSDAFFFLGCHEVGHAVDVQGLLGCVGYWAKYKEDPNNSQRIIPQLKISQPEVIEGVREEISYWDEGEGKAWALAYLDKCE